MVDREATTGPAPERPSMSTQVMLLVLFGAFLHASWNAIVKSGDHKLRDAGLIAGGGALAAVVFLPFAPLPDAACVPWLLGSVVIHQVYYGLVAAAYRAGDLGHTYPLMRGTAPLLVAIASGPLIGETLSLTAWIGIALICGGILLLALHRHAAPRATLVALANATIIALYTLVDGTGARASGAPISYTLWLMVLSATPLLAWLFWQDAGAMRRQIAQRGTIGLIGGTCSALSYGLALWAMTVAPLAAVAALRETSVLFAVAISTFILREGGGAGRFLAAALVVGGAVALRLI